MTLSYDAPDLRQQPGYDPATDIYTRPPPPPPLPRPRPRAPVWPSLDLITPAAAAEDVSPWAAKQPAHKPPADMPVPSLDEGPSPWATTLPAHTPAAAPPPAAPPAAPAVPASESLREGYLDIAGIGGRPAFRAASVASGLPEWLGGFRAPIGAAEMAIESATRPQDLGAIITGENKGPVRRAYETELQRARQRQEEAFEAHPGVYRAGEAAGLGATLFNPAVRIGQGAGAISRALTAGGTGATYGGIHGALTAEPGSELSGAGQGALVGGLAGAGVSSAVDAVSPAVRAITGRFQNWWQGIRSLVDQGYIDEEAGRRILQGRLRDLQMRGGPALTQQDLNIAARAHIPITNVERGGGESTLGLARAASNRSTEARTLLADLARERFQQQGPRARNFISSLFGGTPDAAAEIARLEDQARIANAPAYRAAYRAGDRPLRSPEIDRLMGSDSVKKAMRSAISTSKDRAIAEGHGAFNPGITVTDDGRIIFARGPGGVPVYPNLQYWDSVHRDLSDMVARAMEREPSKAQFLTVLHQQLTNEIDRMVPEFATARAGAARFLGAKSAYEAGQNFVMTKARDANYQYRQQLNDMSPAERELFSRGFASELINRITQVPDNRDVINQAFFNSQSARQRIRMALGPQRADQVEAYLRVESIADRLRTALGNSTTARQLHDMGLAGPVGGFLAAEHLELGHWQAMAAAIAAAYLTHRGNAAQVGIAHRIGELLASDNPIQVSRAIRVAAANPQIMAALRAVHNDLPAFIGRSAGQIPSGAPAEQPR